MFLPTTDREQDFAEDPGGTLPFLPKHQPPPVVTGGVGANSLPETGDRFVLIEEVGRGSMGVVYRGIDNTFGRKIALKVLQDRHRSNLALRRRFKIEARITAHLQHPGIVPVYEVGELPTGLPFYSMRFAESPTLADFLTARSHPHEDRPSLLRTFEKVCDALAYAHHQGVIHCDIKPANVLVGGFGRVLLMDWGVAKVLPHSPLAAIVQALCGTGDTEEAADASDEPTHGRVVGTPAYMAPEQARGASNDLDERTDVFNLGGLLLTLLTGDPPYTGDNTRAVCRTARRGELGPAYDRLAASGADPELAALCRRCLSPDPRDRPPNASAVTGELAECLSDDLRRTESDMIRFFELSMDLFCIAGANGYFRRVNSNFTRVLGYTVDYLLRSPFLELIHPDDRERTADEVARVAAGAPGTPFLNRFRDVTGHYRWFEWTGKSVPAEGIIFAVGRDVTDRVLLEELIRAGQGV